MTGMLMLSIIEEFLPGYRPLFPHAQVAAKAPPKSKEDRASALARLEAAIEECRRPGTGTRLKVTVQVGDLALLINAVRDQ